MADDGARYVPYYNQTLAEVIANVTVASDRWDAVVEIRNLHARVSVHPVSKQLGNGRGDADLPNTSLLEQLAPSFLHLKAEGIDAEALREPASAWLQAADRIGSSQWASEILSQVADAVRTEDLYQGTSINIRIGRYTKLSDGWGRGDKRA